MTQYLIYDIECYKNYFLVVTYDINTGIYESYNLGSRLINKIINNDKVVLIGWNNHSYDDLLLNHIAQHSHALTNPFGSLRPTIILTEQHLQELSTEIITNKDMTDRVMRLKYADKIYKSLDIKSLLDPMPGLKKLEIRTNFHNVQDLPIDPESITTVPQQLEILNYCKNDVDATYNIYKNHALTHIALRQFLADKFEIDPDLLTSSSEPRTAEHILSTQAVKGSNKIPWQIKQSLAPIIEIPINKCIPKWIKFSTPNMQNLLTELKELVLPVNPITGYAVGTKLKRKVQIGDREYRLGIGGLHSEDESGCYESTTESQLIDADVTSYYPSILLRDGAFPRGYNNYWNDVYKKIYDDRLLAKADPDRTTEAHALKIILNATFGKFGSKYSSFYDPRLLLEITITGQLALLMLIEACDLKSIEVLSANTDGILVNLKTGLDQQRFKRICEYWEKTTKMNLEYTYYNKYVRRDVNNYTALTNKNKIKNKGIFAIPDIKHDVKAPIITKASSWCVDL